MTTNAQQRWMARGGFTLVEVVIAMALSVLVVAFVVPGYVWILRLASGGSLQARFNGDARLSERKIDQYMRSGRAAEISGSGVRILTTSNTYARIEYADLDGNSTTLSNNVIRYFPNVDVTNSVILCTYVSPFPGECMFTNPAVSASAVQFSYHIGEGSDPAYASLFGSSPGYQGVEVRFAATPRNLQKWYD